MVVRRGVANEAGAAWEVTSRSPWRNYISSPITDILLRYHPWDDQSGGYWCTRVSLSFGNNRVEMLLGDREPQGAALVPSSDNVAVLLDPDALPNWERIDDLV